MPLLPYRTRTNKWHELLKRILESCSAVLSTIYSSGGEHLPQISTVKTNNTCAKDFGGTSAVNPFAAGVIGMLHLFTTIIVISPAEL